MTPAFGQVAQYDAMNKFSLASFLFASTMEDSAP
jgi:hypothetical protein